MKVLIFNGCRKVGLHTDMIHILDSCISLERLKMQILDDARFEIHGPFPRISGCLWLQPFVFDPY